MKHHFGDCLDREGDYWTVVPNRERYAYRIDSVPAGDEEVTIATIGSDDSLWRNVFTFPNLEELTLHSPSHEQLQAIAELAVLRRLRITHARPKEITFISPLSQIEELVLEYVSGFSDLSPLRSLPRLKSLHIENLRKVTDFRGLSGLACLRYLQIDGTLDWKQPIADFEFLRGLPNLEVLSFGQIINKTPYPALLPALALKKLKRLKLTWNMLAAEEYALLEVGLHDVEGANWGPYTRFEYSPGEEWFEFTGKGAGRAKCGHANAEHKCAEYTVKYEKMKAEAERTISNSQLANQ
ncbi:Leucine Rich repeats (2 copies) [Planctomycetes bacterium CA13]|uniref:Leucine Rich repeats (2 copies) n=1 Tax=Novipirellula herctigrandis TaxID=2527986 RepID=A0A5C5YVS6_9BACT|nr:Leucine Rich repeats (2 copies) [Planctomycetes bacterium CA13]